VCTVVVLPGSLSAPLVTLLLLLCPAFTTTDARSAPGPTTLQVAPSSARRATCVLRTSSGTRRVALSLPRGFVPGLPADYRGPRCAFHRFVRGGDVVLLALEPARPGHTVRALYADQLTDAVPGPSPDGDDSVLHLSLRAGVPTYGRTTGDRLSYLCFCDGQNLLYRAAEADGVLLTWTSQLVRQRETDRQLEEVLTSLGVTG
jgi:hypothetical protein